MYRAVEEPLDVHLPFASESKSIESEGGTDVGKDRLHGREPFIIDETTLHGIYFAFHLLGEALGEVWGTSLEEVDLSCFRTVGITEALFSKSAREAVGLVPPELDGNSLVVNYDITSVAVQALAGRADAVALILAHGKIACRIGSRRTKERGLLFPEALLVPVSFEKAGVPFPELGVGYVSIDALLHEGLHILLRVEAGIGGELGFVEYIGSADGSEIIPGALHHGFEQCLFLGCTISFGRDDDLVLVIHDGYAVVALDDPVGGLHRCTLVVGDIALYGFAGLTGFVIMLFQPGSDLLDVPFQRGYVLLFLGNAFLLLFFAVRLLVAGDDATDHLLHLLFLFGKVLFGAAPLF